MEGFYNFGGRGNLIVVQINFFVFGWKVKKIEKISMEES